jgi:hypothetical protein
VDKMVLHLRSSNIDGKSSRFMNIEVVIVNAIMIRFRFMDGTWHNDFSSGSGTHILQSNGVRQRRPVSP